MYQDKKQVLCYKSSMADLSKLLHEF